MKINYRMKRTTRQYIIVAIICIVIIGGAAITTTVFVTNQIKGECNALLAEAESDMSMLQRYVYVTLCDITAGDTITENNTKKLSVYSSQPQSSFITSKELGQQALVDIPQETQIMRSMLTDTIVTSDLREVEYRVLHINANIIDNDIIDVRIFYPNGENYIVLSKKAIKGIAEGSVMCYLWLDAEELLKMSAAIVDAASYPGTQLITTKYIEPSIQEPSVVTYNPSLAVLELLETDPNILDRSSRELEKNARKALENRLAASMTTDLTTVSWDINPYQTKDIEEDTTETQEETEDAVTHSVDNEEGNASIDLEENQMEYFYYVDEQAAKDGVLEYGE
jgi:hypothetical protein